MGEGLDTGGSRRCLDIRWWIRTRYEVVTVRIFGSDNASMIEGIRWLISVVST